MQKITPTALTMHTEYLRGERANLFLGEYAGGEPALLARSPSGEPLMTISVNLPLPPSPGCVWVKDWSENQGVLEWLLDVGIAVPTGRTQTTGYTSAQEVRLILSEQAA